MKQTRLNLAPTVATSPSPQILLVDASKTFLKAACQMLQEAGWRCHRNAIHDCILLLHETKRRFKSKELAQIRQTLEELMQTSR